jgi:hypothetical protein
MTNAIRMKLILSVRAVQRTPLRCVWIETGNPVRPLECKWIAATETATADVSRVAAASTADE